MPEDGLVMYVEDDPAVRLGSTQALQLAGYEVRGYESAEAVLPQLRPGLRGVLVTDVRLPGASGLELLEKVQKIDPSLPVVLVTGHGDIAMAVQAMRQGAYDFIEKPFSPELLADVVRRALEKRLLSLEVESLRSRLEHRDAIEARLIGRSAAMERLRRAVLDFAPTNADVLITGETGTGKELVARCLHDFGPGKDSPFAAINCGGVQENLFESEVFGHEAGSFTGASKRRIGKIEYAAGGSLFLDEIETMSLNLQVKLLRALQERTFERLGSNELLPMNCRVIAATKSDLRTPPKEQPFRSDLYYRLSVLILEIPPLRERREDIPLLFGHFLIQAGLRYQRPIPELSQEQLHELMRHPWPGNVRELRNASDRMVLGMGFDGMSAPATEGRRSLDEQLAAFERQLIQEALAASGGRVSSASELLRLPRKTLYDRMRRLDLAGDDFRAT